VSLLERNLIDSGLLCHVLGRVGQHTRCQGRDRYSLVAWLGVVQGLEDG
jgi:hypothetical protein